MHRLLKQVLLRPEILRERGLVDTSGISDPSDRCPLIPHLAENLPGGNQNLLTSTKALRPVLRALDSVRPRP